MKLNISRDSIKAVTFYNEEGSELDVDRHGSMSFGDDVTFEYAFKGKVPEKGRIVAEVYKDMKEYVIPFNIRNISLWGEPLE